MAQKNPRSLVKSVDSKINIRLQTLIRSWPQTLAGDFSDYCLRLHRADACQAESSATGCPYPYWILLPLWLESKYQAAPQKSAETFFADVLWAEYCLFLSLRLQDDIFDLQTDKFSLLFAANLVFLEAEDVLSRYFDCSSEFWTTFRQCQRQSSCAIAENANLHQSLQRSPGKLLAGYAKVASIFDIGLAAICIFCERQDDLPHLTKFSAAMAIAGQIIDDLEDIEEDLNGGKYNYAVQRLLRQCNTNTIDPETILAIVGKEMLLSEGLSALCGEIRRHLTLAEKAIKPLGLPEAVRMVQWYKMGMDQMQERLLIGRVDWIFKKYGINCQTNIRILN